MEPKISIIVPVYNAEAYLRKCLDSIAAQTHKNLEVILVDDGSPDNCPAICDEYAANDPRFKVIHKENGGPGSAVNVGLDVCTGEWLTFVDNDDWMEPDMYEYLLAGAQRHGVKMSACGFSRPNGKQERTWSFEQEHVISGRQAAKDILDGGTAMEIVPWQKIYARELWDGIRFAEGPDATPDIFPGLAVPMRVDAVVCLPGVKYYNVQRPTSYSKNVTLKRMLAFYRSWEEMYNGLFTGEAEFQTRIINKTVLAAWWVWSACYTAPHAEREAAMPQLREISAFCRPHINRVVRDPHTGPAGRIGCRLVAWPAWWAFALSYVLRKLSDWKHGAAL